MLELFHPKCKGPELKAKGGRHPKTDLGQGRLTYRSLGKSVMFLESILKMKRIHGK